MNYSEVLTTIRHEKGIVALFAGYDGSGEFCHRITLLIVKDSAEELAAEVTKQQDALLQFFHLMHTNLLRSGSDIRVIRNQVQICNVDELPKSWS